MIFSLIVINLFNPIKKEEDYWRVLSKVTYKTEKDTDTGFEIERPVFDDVLLRYDGKEITLKGYILPLDQLGGQDYFMFSQFPYNTCFFCGGAGPETVVEVYASHQIRFTNDAVTIKGKLKLNKDNPDHHMYILNKAELLK
ncbi:hypothetical protein [Splendidivirga corallicola]|uniref:hypothetical protein n=1 Tax=Splendidivirga corallicola TaxID=3051826 RepID=UPI0032119CF3